MIKKIAVEEKFDLILENSVYASPNIDITQRSLKLSMTKNEISVKDLVALFGGELYGNDNLRINGFKDLVNGSKIQLLFLPEAPK